MKLVIDVLTDARQMLHGLDGVREMRAQTRETLRELIEDIDIETDRILQELRQFDCEGEQHLSDAGESDDQSTEQLVQRGLTALAEESFDEAQAWFERAHHRDPEEPLYLNHLGLLAWERGDFAGAASRYEEAMDAALTKSFHRLQGSRLRLDAEEAYARAMEGRALSLYKLESFREASQLFDCLANMFPDDYASCRYLQGEVLQAAGAEREALRAYRRAPAEPALYYNRALVRWTSGYQIRATRDMLRGVAANRHIAERITRKRRHDGLGSSGSETDEVRPSDQGYLSSARYAEDYLEACEFFWRREDATVARRVLGSCLEDGRAQQFFREQQTGHMQFTSGDVRVEPNASGTAGLQPPSDSLVRGLLADVEPAHSE